MNPDLTHFDMLNHRVYSIITPNGWIHVTDDKHVFEHASDAVRYLKGLAENPVVAALQEQADEQEQESSEG